ncbi:hypothetical protein LJC58_06550 [Lachnospiraceae bacterium OttesenSCG-928-D06]|nr:hypothetical protein [Lachnospiraceae bacterium OttesenSCG-928-D06]
MVRTFLKTKFMEDGKLLWYSIEVFVIFLALVIREEEAYGLALLIAAIYFGGYFIASFNIRSGTETILQGSSFYRSKKNLLIIAGGLLDNLLLGVAVLLFINMVPGRNLWVTVLYAINIYCFSTAIGIFVGVLAKSQMSGFLLCTILSIINFTDFLFQEEYFRFTSPVVQIGNLARFQWWNQLTLLIISLTIFFVLIYNKKIVWVIFVIGIIIIGGVDVLLSRNIHTPPELPIIYRDILEEVNIQNREHGLPYYENIVVYKSVYYPWMSNSNKRPIYIEGDTLYVNCFTESLCNLEAEELIQRMILSIMKPHSIPQDSIAVLYFRYLIGDMEYVNSFLYEEQRMQYGEVVSFNYGLYAEVLVNSPKRYGELYALAQSYNTNQEILDAWNDEVDD